MPLAAITSLTLWQTTQFLAEYNVKVFRERGLVAIPFTYARWVVSCPLVFNIANFAVFCKHFMKKSRLAAFFRD
jgi:hypothetical protein